MVVMDSTSAFLAAEGQVQSETLLLAGFLCRPVRESRPFLGSLMVVRWPHTCPRSSGWEQRSPLPDCRARFTGGEKLGLAWLSSELNCALCVSGHRKKEHLKLCHLCDSFFRLHHTHCTIMSSPKSLPVTIVLLAR